MAFIEKSNILKAYILFMRTRFTKFSNSVLKRMLNRKIPSQTNFNVFSLTPFFLSIVKKGPNDMPFKKSSKFMEFRPYFLTLKISHYLYYISLYHFLTFVFLGIFLVVILNRTSLIAFLGRAAEVISTRLNKFYKFDTNPTSDEILNFSSIKLVAFSFVKLPPNEKASILICFIFFFIFFSYAASFYYITYI